MPRRKKIKPDEPKTSAAKNMEASLDPLVVLIGQMRPVALRRKARSLQKVLADFKKLPTPTSKDVERLRRGHKELTALNADLTHHISFVSGWLGVILWTLFQTYLEDGLIEVAKRNPKALDDAPALGAEFILDARSLEDLQTEVRSQWAQKLLAGGPLKWEKRLERMGLKDLDAPSVEALQHLFDTRNIVAHNRSIASKDFATRYKNYEGVEEGKPLPSSLRFMGAWIDAMKKVSDKTEEFFLKYGTERATAPT